MQAHQLGEAAVTNTLRRYLPNVAATGRMSTDMWRDLCMEIERVQALVPQGALQHVDDFFVDPSSRANPGTPANTPAPAKFSVVGLDGKFIISIANPQNVPAESPQQVYSLLGSGYYNATPVTMVHNLQSCTT